MFRRPHNFVCGGFTVRPYRRRVKRAHSTADSIRKVNFMRLPSTKRLIGAAALVALASIALAGCSSSASASGSSSSSAGSSSDGTFAKDSGTLVFAATPDQAGSDSNNKPLEDYIAQQTGLKVEYFPTSDYTALIAAMVAGKADITTSGGLQYVMATNKGADYDPVAAMLNSPGVTEAGYYSEAIVNPGSGVTDVAGFKGKKVCFVDPTSTSGYFYPLLAMKAAGIDITPTGTDASGNPTFKDFTAYFAGTHPKSVQAVASGQCDVGFAEDTESEAKGSGVTVVKDAAKVGDGLGRQLVPGSPIVISDTLPASLKKKLTKILGTVSTTTLKNAGFTPDADFYGILPETKAFYDPIYKGCADATIAKAAAAVCG